MNRTEHRKEGLYYYPSNEFESLEGIEHEFAYTISMEITMFDIPVYLWHRVTDDGYLQWARGSERDKIEGVIGQFKRTKADLKTDLTALLQRDIHGCLPFNGIPSYGDSPIFSKEEFDEIIEAICAKADSATRNAFIDFLEAKGLYPRPTGYSEFSWMADCAQGQHFMMVSTKDNTWGCGYHKRKGGQAELEAWLDELNRE